jgi:hypothetical protein
MLIFDTSCAAIDMIYEFSLRIHPSGEFWYQTKEFKLRVIN